MVHSSSGRYGADRQLELIATGLDRSRYEPLAVLPHEGPLASDLRRAEVEVLVRPPGVLRRGETGALGLGRLAASAGRSGLELSVLIRRRRVALVHSNTSVVLGGAVAAGLARVPHLWHVREIYSRFGRLWPPYRRLLATATLLPCVSAAAAAQFPEARRVRVIHDGLALDVRRAPRMEARGALGLDADAPVVAVVGRVSDWKGQSVLVRALAEPPLRRLGAVGMIAGEAWPGAERRLQAVLELAERLGVRERLALVGFRPDVDAVYGAADVVAVPSTAPDPLPGAAIEAAAAGCAVLASDTGGLPEIIDERRTGRLFAPGDARALAALAAELIERPEERQRLGAAAAADVRERFGPARMLEQLQHCYDLVVSDTN